MKLLMIACVPFFSERGTPISIRTRLETLSRLGHRVDLITYPVGKDLAIPGVRIFRTPALPFIRTVPVGPSLSKLLLDILVFFRSLGFLMVGKYDIVHTHEESCYFGALFSKIFRIRHLYDFHSSLPQVMRNFGYGNHAKIINTLEIMERTIINSCSGIITISPALDAYIGRINDTVPRMLIENVQNYSFGDVDESRLSAFRKSRPEFEGKRIVLYAGTFELYQGLDLLIDSAEKVIEKYKDAVFVLAGGMRKQIDRLRESVQIRGIGANFLFTGSIPREELALYMGVCEVLVSTRISGNNPPLKIYDYMSAGKPIVATNIDAHTQVINKDIAVLVEPDADSVSEGILWVLENRSPAAAMARRSRVHFDGNYSSEENMKKTSRILDAVMEARI